MPLPDLSLLLHHPIPPDGAADFSALVRPRGGAGPQLSALLQALYIPPSFTAPPSSFFRHWEQSNRRSPISPTTQPSPMPTSCMPNSYSLHSPEIPLMSGSSDQAPRCDIVPMKGFVHEVLRRSRTSGSVLQTALCYLEAIRAKSQSWSHGRRVALGPLAPWLAPHNHQPLPSDPQLPLWSPPDTSAQRAPPSTLHPPLLHSTPLLIFPALGAVQSTIQTVTSMTTPTPMKTILFLPPLATRWVCWMGGDVDMDDDDGMVLDSSRCRVISLDSHPSGSTRLPPLPLRWKNPCSLSCGSPRRRHTTVARRLAQLPSPLLVTFVHSRNCGMGRCSFVVWRLAD
ncbi:hypothetical protein F4604DRAFT_1924947 [Suillus subluteus]|nr:hypothetical protein F4604DRAFT_1924947 [Suillus subluteus]